MGRNLQIVLRLCAKKVGSITEIHHRYLSPDSHCKALTFSPAQVIQHSSGGDRPRETQRCEFTPYSTRQEMILKFPLG
jgi:hypothetical protein